MAYVRYINNINLQNLRRAGLFIDIANRALDAEAVRLLANLRDERLPAKIEPTNLQRLSIEIQCIIDERGLRVIEFLCDAGTRLSGSVAMVWEMTRTKNICKILLLTFTEILPG